MDVSQAADASGIKLSSAYSWLRRADVQEYLAEIEREATKKAGISKADVIARLQELSDIALGRSPIRMDRETGEPVYLKTPNLTIAARMAERLGDAVGAWVKAESDHQSGAEVHVWNVIQGGDADRPLADAMIDRIDPGRVINHQPDGETERDSDGNPMTELGRLGFQSGNGAESTD